ncbi:hypothetical protein ACI6Q2_05540 [Chitinophagaceae bacterium LWZ2-11]
MKKISVIFFALALAVIACKKEDKPYDGAAQVAFANTTYAFKITKDTTVVIPVQLISNAAQPSFTVKVAADSSAVGTIVGTSVFPATYTFDNNRFITNVSINASFAGFGADKSKALRLKLSSDSKKVAENYKTTIVTFSRN